MHKKAFARLVLLQCLKGLNWSELLVSQPISICPDACCFKGCLGACEPDLSNAGFHPCLSLTKKQKIHV